MRNHRPGATHPQFTSRGQSGQHSSTPPQTGATGVRFVLTERGRAELANHRAAVARLERVAADTNKPESVRQAARFALERRTSRQAGGQ